MKHKLTNRHARGFSLVELLVVIAVIGIIAAIAIPAMSGIFGSTETTKSTRNAQNIAGTYAAAKSAGNTATYANKAAAVAAVTSGSGLSGAGVFSGSKFLSAMSTAEGTAAEAYLAYNTGNGMLTYTADGGESVSSGGGGGSPPPDNNPWMGLVTGYASEADAIADFHSMLDQTLEFRAFPHDGTGQWQIKGRRRL